MKLPATPPPLLKLLAEIPSDRVVEILSSSRGPAPQGKYRHWDTLRHLAAPEGLTSEEWWTGIKLARTAARVALPLWDRGGAPFTFAPVAVAQQMLMEVDRDASGRIQASEQVTDPETRNSYLLKGLMEEAITSSQLEGASTTREVAKDMIREGRAPRTHGERMIHNNYQALAFIRRMGKTPLTPGMVFEFHRILTDGTLDEPEAAGRLRRADEDVCVADEFGTVLHSPPAAEELEARMQAMCDFANGTNEGEAFLHPVVRAIVLHFWLAYDHPFVDGNGRTARALFYWSMVRQGYWLCEFISISRVLKKAPSRYGRSFLYTETDDNDLTYFILYQLKVTLAAIRELFEYLDKKQRELRATQLLITRSPAIREQLNSRQLGIVRHAMKHPHFTYTIESHKNSNNISYATSRSDLLKLVEIGLLDQRKGPKRLTLFVSPPDLRQRIATVA